MQCVARCAVSYSSSSIYCIISGIQHDCVACWSVIAGPFSAGMMLIVLLVFYPSLAFCGHHVIFVAKVEDVEDVNG